MLEFCFEIILVYGIIIQIYILERMNNYWINEMIFILNDTVLKLIEIE